MNNSENIKKLFQRFLDDECTLAEVKTLLQYFDAGENEVLLRDLIRKQSETIGDIPLSSEQSESLLENTYRKIANEIARDTAIAPSPVIHLYHRLWFRISAAAAVIFFVSITAFYFLYQDNNRVTLQTQNSAQLIKDIPPGTNNAILTLDNGTTIVLDSAANGTLVQQGGIKVLKINGQIAYDKTGNANLQAAPIYNTITTARGNQYQVVLADGSKVWLNAASSIRFPSYFTGNKRKVEITGEAYFEVAPLTAKGGHEEVPFIVSVVSSLGDGRGAEIEVLGTHFNVNAYADEEDVKTTLLEGSVKVSKGNESVLIVPGEQARISSNPSSKVKAMTIKKDVALSQVVAWKDGFFMFNNSDIKTIMRQVARWYDVEVDFEGKLPEEGFTGKVSRNVLLSKFIKVLELNDINVRTDGRKITIVP